MTLRCKKECALVKQTAFTLIELLVVVTIISVLAVMTITAIARVKVRAKDIECKSNLKQSGIYLNVFVSDNHEYPLWANPGYSQGAYTAHRGSWLNAIYDRPRSFGFNKSPNSNSKGILICPSISKKPAALGNIGWTSYGYNCNGIVERTTAMVRGLGGSGMITESILKPVKDSEIWSPSQMLAIGDGFTEYQGYIQEGTVQIGRLTIPNPYPVMSMTASKRHHNMLNNVFCDGHIEAFSVHKQYLSKNTEDLKYWSRDNQGHPEDL